MGISYYPVWSGFLPPYFTNEIIARQPDLQVPNPYRQGLHAGKLVIAVNT